MRLLHSSLLNDNVFVFLWLTEMGGGVGECVCGSMFVANNSMVSSGQGRGGQGRGRGEQKTD